MVFSPIRKKMQKSVDVSKCGEGGLNAEQAGLEKDVSAGVREGRCIYFRAGRKLQRRMEQG